jgi:hypothetical protein
VVRTMVRCEGGEGGIRTASTCLGQGTGGMPPGTRGFGSTGGGGRASYDKKRCGSLGYGGGGEQPSTGRVGLPVKSVSCWINELGLQ